MDKEGWKHVPIYVDTKHHSVYYDGEEVWSSCFIVRVRIFFRRLLDKLFNRKREIIYKK